MVANHQCGSSSKGGSQLAILQNPCTAADFGPLCDLQDGGSRIFVFRCVAVVHLISQPARQIHRRLCAFHTIQYRPEREHEMRTPLFALLLLLTSCADFQPKAAQQAAQPHIKRTLAQADVKRPVAPKERQRIQNDADDAECRSHGVKPGSSAYLACRMIIANRRPTEIAQAQ